MNITGHFLQATGFTLLLLTSILRPKLFGILNWPVVTQLGVLSYSIYIWQQLFCADPVELGLQNHWWFDFPGWIFAAIATATLSYYGLERPFLKLRSRLRR